MSSAAPDELKSDAAKKNGSSAGSTFSAHELSAADAPSAAADGKISMSAASAAARNMNRVCFGFIFEIL